MVCLLFIPSKKGDKIMTYFDFWDFYGVSPHSNATSSSTNRLTVSSPYYISAPGYSKSDIIAELKDGNILSISGKSDEYGGINFSKSLYLSKDVDTKTIQLTVKDGMITIEYKLKEEESRKIAVK